MSSWSRPILPALAGEDADDLRAESLDPHRAAERVFPLKSSRRRVVADDADRLAAPEFGLGEGAPRGEFPIRGDEIIVRRADDGRGPVLGAVDDRGGALDDRGHGLEGADLGLDGLDVPDIERLGGGAASPGLIICPGMSMRRLLPRLAI